jgi:hypothetical protein
MLAATEASRAFVATHVDSGGASSNVFEDATGQGA